MGRDPSKSEEIRIYCRPQLKTRWETFVIKHAEDNPEALRKLLNLADENPELLGGYFG